MREECVGTVLTVQCKGREAHLHLRDLARSIEENKKKGHTHRWRCTDPCVAYENQRFTPNEFVTKVCGLKEARPAWHGVFYHAGKQMKTLLDDGTVTLKPPVCRCTECQKPRPSPSKRKKNNTKKKVQKDNKTNRDSDRDSDSSDDTEVPDSEDEQGVVAASTKTGRSKWKPPAKKVATLTAKNLRAKKLRARALCSVARHPTRKVVSKKSRRHVDATDDSEEESQEVIPSKKQKLLKGKSTLRTRSSKVSCVDQDTSDDTVCKSEYETEDFKLDTAQNEPPTVIGSITPVAMTTPLTVSTRIPKSAVTPLSAHKPSCTILHLTSQTATRERGPMDDDSPTPTHSNHVGNDTSGPTRSKDVDRQLTALMEAHENLARKINDVKSENSETLTKLSDCVAGVATDNKDILTSFVKTVEMANNENKEALAKLAQSVASTYTVQSTWNKELLDKVVEVQQNMAKTQESMAWNKELLDKVVEVQQNMAKTQESMAKALNVALSNQTLTLSNQAKLAEGSKDYSNTVPENTDFPTGRGEQPFNIAKTPPQGYIYEDGENSENQGMGLSWPTQT